MKSVSLGVEYFSTATTATTDTATTTASAINPGTTPTSFKPNLTLTLTHYCC